MNKESIEIVIISVSALLLFIYLVSYWFSLLGQKEHFCINLECNTDLINKQLQNIFSWISFLDQRIKMIEELLPPSHDPDIETFTGLYEKMDNIEKKFMKIFNNQNYIIRVAENIKPGRLNKIPKERIIDANCFQIDNKNDCNSDNFKNIIQKLESKIDEISFRTNKIHSRMERFDKKNKEENEKKKRAETRSKEQREKAVKQSNAKASELMSGIFGQKMETKIGSSINPELESALKLGQNHELISYRNESTSTIFNCKDKHDFTKNDPIIFISKKIPIPLSVLPQKYYVTSVENDKKSFKISHTIGGPPILLQKKFDIVSIKKVGSVSEFKTNIKHDLELGDYIQFTGKSLPIPLRGYPKKYFVGNISKDNLTFQISEMKGGMIILLNTELKTVSDKISISTFEPPKGMNELLKVMKDKKQGGSIMTTILPHNFSENDFIEFENTILPIKSSPHRYFIRDVGQDKLTFKISEKKDGKPIEFIENFDKLKQKIIITVFGIPKEIKITNPLNFNMQRTQVRLAEVSTDRYSRNMELAAGDNPEMSKKAAAMNGDSIAANSSSLQPDTSKEFAAGGTDTVNQSLNDPENSDAASAKDKMGDAQKDADIPDDFKI
jgi:hypothetical protein